MWTALRHLIRSIVPVLIKHVEVGRGIAVINLAVIIQSDGSKCHHRLVTELTGVDDLRVPGIERVDGERGLALQSLFLRQHHAVSRAADGLPRSDLKVTGFLVFQHAVPGHRIEAITVGIVLCVIVGRVDVLNRCGQQVTHLKVNDFGGTVHYHLIVDLRVVGLRPLIDWLVTLVVVVQIVDVSAVLVVVVDCVRQDIPDIAVIDHKCVRVEDGSTVKVFAKLCHWFTLR